MSFTVSNDNIAVLKSFFSHLKFAGTSPARVQRILKNLAVAMEEKMATRQPEQRMEAYADLVVDYPSKVYREYQFVPKFHKPRLPPFTDDVEELPTNLEADDPFAPDISAPEGRSVAVTFGSLAKESLTPAEEKLIKKRAADKQYAALLAK
jgi:hypothetical protein